MPARSHFISVPEEILHCISFVLVYFGIVYIWPMYQSLDGRIWFTIIFFPIKKVFSVKSSEIFLGGIQYKYGLPDWKFSLLCGFKNIGLSRISSTDVKVERLLLAKSIQALTNWTKKSSLLCFCKFLCLLDLRICFCLKKGRPWLEFRVKFSQYTQHEIFQESIGRIW